MEIAAGPGPLAVAPEAAFGPSIGQECRLEPTTPVKRRLQCANAKFAFTSPRFVACGSR